VKATAGTNYEEAAAIVAEKFGENEDLIAKMQAATKDAPVIISVMASEAMSSSSISRINGFVCKMVEVASQYGTVAVDGHDRWADGNVATASILIEVAVSATTDRIDIENSAKWLLQKTELAAVFCSSETTVEAFLSAVSNGEDLVTGGKYDDLIVSGFDAGAAQKNAVRNGWFYGSVVQDPYMMGYYAVEMAIAAVNGYEVSDKNTGVKWYDASNIDDEMIALLAYD